MHLRYYGKLEILDVVVPDGSYVIRSDRRLGRGSRQRLVVPWRGSEIAFSSSMVPILATLGEFGMRLRGVLRRTDQMTEIS